MFTSRENQVGKDKKRSKISDCTSTLLIAFKCNRGLVAICKSPKSIKSYKQFGLFFPPINIVIMKCATPNPPL